jgi:hypothetical protein
MMHLTNRRLIFLAISGFILMLLLWRKIPIIAANRFNESGIREASRGDFNGARGLFEESGNHGLKALVPSYNIAGTFMAEKDYGMAHKYYESILREEPDFVEALYNDGHALYDLGAQEIDDACSNAPEIVEMWNASIGRFQEVARVSGGSNPLNKMALENIAFIEGRIKELNACYERNKPKEKAADDAQLAKDQDRDQSKDLYPALAADRDRDRQEASQSANGQANNQSSGQSSQRSKQAKGQGGGQSDQSPQQAASQQDARSNPGSGGQAQGPASNQGAGQSSTQSAGQANAQGAGQSGQGSQQTASGQSGGSGAQNSDQAGGQANGESSNQDPQPPGAGQASAQGNGGDGQGSQADNNTNGNSLITSSLDPGEQQQVREALERLGADRGKSTFRQSRAQQWRAGDTRGTWYR